MLYLLFLFLSMALCGGFLYLTMSEQRRGARVFREHRASLDASVEHAEFVLEHIDFEAFLREQVRWLIARIAHDVAHLFLLTVRFAERLLTRLVKHLRIRHEAQAVVAGSPRAFVQAMSDFKRELSATREDAPTNDHQAVG